MSTYRGTLLELANRVLDETSPENIMRHHIACVETPTTLEEINQPFKNDERTADRWRAVHFYVEAHVRSALAHAFRYRRLKKSVTKRVRLLMRQALNPKSKNLIQEMNEYMRRCSRMNNGRVSPVLANFNIFRQALLRWQAVLQLLQESEQPPEIRQLFYKVHEPLNATPPSHAN
ncbi:MAG: hypothetical protein Greene041619_488 [Candidatus Peregrinibacteria bacterium Greene0416_19]|nr:MAG: hypothetical protein Greene041619_488 [Candidatus Peregrinibacteria bacterium Greene0416_19]